MRWKHPGHGRRSALEDRRHRAADGAPLSAPPVRDVVAGLGVQGRKRCRIAGDDFVAAVDPVNLEARYRSITDAPLADYDAVLACIPDEPKLDLLTYCLENGKHVLVEKPLWAKQ